MAKALTVKAIERIKPDPKKRLHIPDGGLTGLYLIVQPTGAKSWAVWYRHGGRQRKLTIGGYPKFGLKQAREAASAALRKVSEGTDPAEERQRVKADAADQRNLFAYVAEQFVTRHVKKKNGKPISESWKAERKRLIEKEVLPKWGKRKIQDITKRNVIELLDGIVDDADRGRGLVANRTLAVIKKLFAWALARDIITSNPCRGIEAPVAEKPRYRVLSDDELRTVWNAADEIGFPFGPMIQLLILSSQRRNEVASMTRDEIKDGVWTIPATRSKNREPHNVPLSDQAQRIIDELPKIRNDEGFLFCTNGRTAASGFSRAKSRIDDLAPLTEDWVFHDLRRTIATGMQRLGIPVQVVEKVLNHTSGSFAGIVGVYQRHSFDSERHAALDTWARLVALIVSDPEWIALVAEHLDSKDNKRHKAFIDSINVGGKTWDRYLAKIGGVSGDNVVPIRETA